MTQSQSQKEAANNAHAEWLKHPCTVALKTHFERMLFRRTPASESALDYLIDCTISGIGANMVIAAIHAIEQPPFPMLPNVDTPVYPDEMPGKETL